MRDEAAGILIAVLLFVLPIVLLLGAVILRGGVSFANKCLPKERPRYYDEDDEEDYSDWDDYDRPRKRREGKIPEPGLGKAMGIVFVGFIAQLVTAVPLFLMGDMIDDEPELALLALLVALPIGFLIASGLRAAMLPTAFGRACLVVLFEYIICIVVGIAVGVPVAVLIAALG